MGDYYSLIARAVSALSDSTADARQNLYERARAALTSSLSRHDPPMSEADIERERSALEAAIQKVEQEASIGQTHTADTAKTKPIQPQPKAETTTSTRSADILPAALREIREDQAHPTLSALEAGNQRAEQEASIGQTQTADTAKTEPTQPQPVKETTASNGPADILPAALRAIREDQTISHPTLPRTHPARKTFVYINRLLLGVTCVISIAFVIAIFAVGPSWAAHILDYLLFAACPVVILCALGMLPIVQARVSKVGLLCTFLVSSYLLGMTTWLSGVLTTLQYWGSIGVVIGLCLGIVGVVPLGIVAATMNADWSMVAMIIVGVLVTYGARDLALELVDTERQLSDICVSQL